MTNIGNTYGEQNTHGKTYFLYICISVLFTITEDGKQMLKKVNLLIFRKTVHLTTSCSQKAANMGICAFVNILDT